MSHRRDRTAPQRVVLFGTYDTAAHPRVAVLRDGVAAHGHDVVELNAPLGASTADKVAAAGSLASAARLLLRMVRSWVTLVRLGLRHRRKNTPDVVVVGYMGHLDVHIARLLWPDTTIVLDHLVGLADTARDRRVGGGLKGRLLAAIDAAALASADIVVTDTAEQRDQLAPAARAKAIVVPVGATQTWFDQEPADPTLPLKVCFVGLYTPLHGAETIGQAIGMLADDDRIEFTMVGKGQDLDVTRTAAAGGRVEWIDWVDSEDLPGLVAAHHVSLGIFGTTPKALRVVPTKVYQGLAAGTAVVTSETEPQRRALGESVVLVPPGDPSALADALRSLADDPDQLSSGRGSGQRFSPYNVVEGLMDNLAELPSTAELSDGPALPLNAWLRFDVVRSVLAGLRPSSVLEIGPGQGALAVRLVNVGWRYRAVEMSDTARERTGELLASIDPETSVVAGLDDLPADEQFGLVCAMEVLEHIEDDEGAISSWAQRVEPGGTLMISTPAWQRRFGTHDAEVGHLRRYDPADMAALMRSVGMQDVQVTVYGFPLGIMLEHTRNLIARVMQVRRGVAEESAIDRTKRSGSWLQPPAGINQIIRRVTWPFRMVQRRFPSKGTGLVAVGRKPQ